MRGTLLLKELIRFTTQHRAYYCYILLSLWIFLLVACMYKYIGAGTGINYLVGYATTKSAGAGYVNSENGTAQKFSKYRERCTPLHHLTRGDDGGILEGWKLQGVLLVIRHGDRGSMSHLRGAVAHVNCGVLGENLVNRYRSFLHNSSSSASGSNHMYWNKVGPFHGFALLPSMERACLLGQLTYKGIAQLLHVGEIMHQIYAHPLGLYIKQMPNKPAINSTPHSLLNSDEVVLYTTRYRRTFQSALALLFTFLPADKWLALNVRESHSMAFCFTDCACPQAELLRRRLNNISDRELTKRADVLSVMQWIGSSILQHTPNGINNPNEVVDALLTVLCHDAPLPCRHSVVMSSDTSQQTAGGSMRHNINAEQLNDVINIDQDDTMIIDAAATAFNENELNDGNVNSAVAAAAAADAILEGCVETTHVDALMSFAIQQSQYESQHVYYKRIGLLRAYGMIRHIVSFMLKMISGDRTKFVLYSGHDWTLQYLTAALGIQTKNTFIPYAARLAFEVYKSEAHTDYYFRVVYNGRDVTQQIEFCEGGKSLRVTRDSRGNKADLCPIENIIRFLHEDYFGSLNATNFKDACGVLIPKANEF